MRNKQNEKINQYYEFLTELPIINNRCYAVNGNYSEIEVERETKYYIYNVEREIYLGPFAKRLFDYCKFGVAEEDLLLGMRYFYPNKAKGEIARYTYMTLQKLKREGFIK